MPETLGTDLALKIRETNPPIPTIICSGYCTEELNRQAQEVDAHSLYMKPIDMALLATTVRQLLDGESPQAQ